MLRALRSQAEIPRSRFSAPSSQDYELKTLKAKESSIKRFRFEHTETITAARPIEQKAEWLLCDQVGRPSDDDEMRLEQRGARKQHTASGNYLNISILLKLN